MESLSRKDCHLLHGRSFVSEKHCFQQQHQLRPILAGYSSKSNIPSSNRTCPRASKAKFSMVHLKLRYIRKIPAVSVVQNMYGKTPVLSSCRMIEITKSILLHEQHDIFQLLLTLKNYLRAVRERVRFPTRCC